MSWKMTLQELIQGTQGSCQNKSNLVFNGVGTDTRVDLTGKVFFALKGDRFDAHDFIEKAIMANASAIVVHRLPKVKVPPTIAVVEVEDTLIALQQLGKFWRLKHSGKVLALTGSNGKTTTKEFAAQLIGSKYKVHFSRGSFNNHWGVPITLLGIEPKHEIIIVEMGMSGLREIEALVQLAVPDVVMVTMVGRGHLEQLGSIENIALAKSEIYEFAPPNATRVYNLTNSFTKKMYDVHSDKFPNSKARTFSESGGKGVDVSFSVKSMTMNSLQIEGTILGVQGAATVPVFGIQNLTNLMAAATFALEAGLTPEEIWRELPNCKAAWGRSQWVSLANGCQVLFDAYNANPESMTAALDNFASLKNSSGEKIAVLGDMLEVGSESGRLHEEMGRRVAQGEFAKIFYFGSMADSFLKGLGSKENVYSAAKLELKDTALSKLLRDAVTSKDTLALIKASHGIGLERVLEFWSTQSK